MQTAVGLGSLEGCMVPGTQPAPADCSSFLPNINSFGNLRATVPILTVTKTDDQRRKEARQELLPPAALGGNIGNGPTFVSESMASLEPSALASLKEFARLTAPPIHFWPIRYVIRHPWLLIRNLVGTKCGLLTFSLLGFILCNYPRVTLVTFNKKEDYPCGTVGF